MIFFKSVTKSVLPFYDLCYDPIAPDDPLSLTVRV